jgi:membrane-associated phospholipid phosphatase
MWRLGVSISGWVAESFTLAGVSSIAVLWVYFWAVPSRRGSLDCRVGETLFLVGLMATYAVVGLIAQYPALAVGFPYADPWLARADAALGINVAALAHWTGGHPFVRQLLSLSYLTFVSQGWFTVIGLSVLGDRDRVWEYVFSLHVCLVVILICLAVWPSVCPQVYYGFKPTIEMNHAIDQIRGFHDGRLLSVHLWDTDGLVSFPSFHAACAILVTWAWRERRWIAVPLAALNLCVIASTFVTGVHYFIDVLGSVPLCISCVLLYRRYGQRLLNE